MKAVILAGGYGTRILEQSQFKPKPMIEIGNMPILWHIMKGYSFYGINDFIICAGYKQNVIKEWFADYYLNTCDVTFDFSADDNRIQVHNKRSEKWRVTVVDTGLDTMTGGRIKRIKSFVNDEPFYLTYGDAVSDIDINELTKYHCSHGKCMTLTAIDLVQQKGLLDIGKDGTVSSFREKEELDSSLINGGFMVCNPQIFDYIKDDSTVFEKEPMRMLASRGELKSYYHRGFWQCMDTQRENEFLQKLWNEGKAPWKIWSD